MPRLRCRQPADVPSGTGDGAGPGGCADAGSRAVSLDVTAIDFETASGRPGSVQEQQPNLVRHRLLCQRAQPARIPRTTQGRAIF